MYLENLEKDFSRMFDAGMFHESPLEFSKIIESLKNLETKINYGQIL